MIVYMFCVPYSGKMCSETWVGKAEFGYFGKSFIEVFVMGSCEENDK